MHKKYWQKVYPREIELSWNQTQYNLYLMDNAFAEFLCTSRIHAKNQDMNYIDELSPCFLFFHLL